MAKTLILLQLVFFLACSSLPAADQNPFSSGNTSEHSISSPAPHMSFLTRIALVQQQLKQRMTGLIKEVKAGQSLQPLFVVLLIAFGYGLVHAAGPGHGKAVAMSFILSRNPSITTGLLFGTLVALFHGFSGAACVLALHFILQKSVSGTLASVSYVTQVVSFSLIALLGLGILIKNGWGILTRFRAEAIQEAAENKEKKAGLLPWAMAVGLVPCPGVVMVMLFCLSMGVLALGLALAACVSLGMAATISLVVIAVVTGKAGLLRMMPEGKVALLENVVGLVSGIAIALLGTMFLFTTVHVAGL